MNFTKNRSQNLMHGIWILTPSLIFSLAFKGPLICIDPFFFPLLERYIRKTYATIGKILWVAIFAVSLFQGWNISPKSYYFFISEALLYSPPTVVAEVVGFFVILGLLIFFRPKKYAGKNFSVIVCVTGTLLVLLKFCTIQSEKTLQTIHTSIRSSVFTNYVKAKDYLATRNQKANDISVSQSFFNQEQAHATPAVNKMLMLVESWGGKERNT